MAKRLLTILILSTLVLAGCGGDEGGDGTAATQSAAADEAYKQARTKRGEAKSTEEKLAITKAFLDEYPVSTNTAYALDAVFYYQGHELDNMADAITYSENIRSKISDPEIAKDVDKGLIGFYAEAGMTARMVELADRLAAVDALDFDDHWNVIEGAVTTEDWKLVRTYCAKAEKMATAEACRAEDPDRDYSEEELSRKVNDRTGMLLVKDGWAQANQGQLDEALAAFAKADELIPRYYFDIPEYDLTVYWGKTLVMKGSFKPAIKRFARSGLIMGNEDSLTGLKEAYIGIHGTDSGFDKYAAELHRSIATTVDDFEMADYKGTRHRFSDLRDDVTLLTLWFPT